MSKFITGLVAALLVITGSVVVLAGENPNASENAQVTLTVTKFRSIASARAPSYVEAVTTLAPHAAAILVDRNGMPTLVARRAVKFEVAIESADPTESYRPLAVLFQQSSDGQVANPDSDGKVNFKQYLTADGKIVIDDKYLRTGREGHYEFFVLVQRTSDGAIGLIDPAIINELVD